MIAQSSMTLSLSLSLSLSIPPNHPSFMTGLLGCILCPHRADVSKSLRVGQHWHFQIQKSIRENCLRVHLCFINRAPNILFILFEWVFKMKRRSPYGYSFVVYCFLDLFKTVFLCSSHLVFIQCILLPSMWSINIIVWSQLQLGKNPVSSYSIHQIFIGLLTCQ